MAAGYLKWESGMAVCRRNGRCIAHLAGFISDKDYYADATTPRPLDLAGNGAMVRADEDRKRLFNKKGLSAQKGDL